MRAFINKIVFNKIHRNTIVFNDAREDPRIDNIALNLESRDRMLVITSAGCNVLDYALRGVEHIDSVDINANQNALLELKLAALNNLDFEDFFALFGNGTCSRVRSLYNTHLKDCLSTFAREFWNRKIDLFDGKRNGGSFYFSGPCGRFARLINFHINHLAGLRRELQSIFDATEIKQQREIYESQIKRKFWTPLIRWISGRDTTLALLGVPLTQRRQIERDFPGGVGKFIETRLTELFTQVPLHDNYFWYLYLFGRYSRSCCPEYLKESNFIKLKREVGNRISIHTSCIADFLSQEGARISKFVLLDHQDWLADSTNSQLRRTWQGIFDRSTSNARVIWRSGGLYNDFINEVPLNNSGQKTTVGECLNYHKELAATLHSKDRVHTYGSLYIADIRKPSSNIQQL